MRIHSLVRSCLFTISCYLISLSIYAATPADDLTHLLNGIQTMRANFSQVVYDNNGRVKQKSTGQMALSRPGKFRWEVKKPAPQIVIANATKLWIYDPDLLQVTIRPLNNSKTDAPALLLSHDNADINSDYNVTQVQSKNAQENWYQLTPKNADNMFASIQMGFIKQQIHDMKLQDHLGNNTVIQFSNLQTNIALSSALFTFKPPADVDVIDETHKK